MKTEQRNAINSLLLKQAKNAGGKEPAETTPLEDASAEEARVSGVKARASESPDDPEVEGGKPETEEELEQLEQGAAGESESEEEEEHAYSELTDRQKERIQKRIGKEVGKRKQSETERDQALARVKQLEAEVRQKQGSNSPVLLNSPEAVENRRQELREEIRTVQKYIRSGGYSDDQGNEITLEELERMEDYLVDERDVTLPGMERVLREREKVEAEQVKKLYPQLLDSTSPEYAEAEELFERVPGLRGVPDARLLVGRMLRGKRLEAAARRKADPVNKPAPPKEPSGGTESRSGVRAPSEQPSKEQALLAAVAARRSQNG